jgi:hypothetical protein
MNGTLSTFKKGITNFLLISVILEIIFFFDPINIFASIVLFFGWLIVKNIILTSKNIKCYPVSFVMILGLAIFHYILPIPLTLLELKPVTFNMNVPFLTFSHHFFFIVAIVISHKFYTGISNGKNIFRSILTKTDFYRIPTNRQIWISALIGLLSIFYIYFIYGQWQTEASDRTLTYYVATIFSQFVWMPLIILFSKFRNTSSLSKKNYKYLIIYSIVVFVISIASNMRTLLFSGIMIIVFLFFIGVMFEYYSLRKLITPVRLIKYSILVLLISGPLLDFGYAMVIVRQERYDLSAAAFLEKTLDVYNDKELLNKIKSIEVGTGGSQSFKIKRWDEGYIDNLLVNRFVNLKISDNCLYFADKIGFKNPLMQTELLNQLSAFTPNFLLNSLELDYKNKMEFSSYSLTDFLYSLAIDDSSVKGSFIIGSMPGLGMAIFGYWYLLVIIPMFIIIFAMFDSFVIVKNGKVTFSFLFFTMLFMVVNYFNDRHVFTYELRFIFRSYIESIIIILLSMKIIRLLEVFLFKSKL